MYTWGYIKDVSLAKLDLDELEATEQNLLSRFPFWANEAITQICSAIKPKRTFQQFNITRDMIGTLQNMPEDFISFGDDVNTRLYDGYLDECHDEDLMFKGYNQIVFWKEGLYTISYNARWYTFDKDLDNDVELNLPADILDCLPSYIAHQCYKVDDETKAAIYRNEYEMFLARIDNTDYKQTKTFKIGGDW
jgi:hypothetical protein